MRPKYGRQITLTQNRTMTSYPVNIKSVGLYIKQYSTFTVLQHSKTKS